MEENGRKKRKGIKALIITICVLAVLICLAAAANYFMKIEPVKGLTIKTEGLTQTISWEIENERWYYEIFRAEDDGAFEYVKTVEAGEEPVCEFTGLTCGTIYRYRVAAVTRFLNKEYRAEDVEVKDKTDTGRVTVCNANAEGTDTVTVTWPEAYKATAYELKWGMSEDIADAETVELSEAEYTLTGLDDDTAYYFSVRAYETFEDPDFPGKYYSDWCSVTSARTDKKLINVRIDGINPDLPMVALTFDDGPDWSGYTERILDKLYEYGGYASFFQLGQAADSLGYLFRRIVDEGHDIGCHTVDHRHMGDSVTYDDIVRANDMIEAACGVRPQAFRSPGGETTSYIREVCYSENQALYYWTIDTRDWEHRNTDRIVEIVKEQVSDGSIILMHNIYGSTADAVDILVPWLVEQGYQLVTVSQLIYAKTGAPPQPGVQYISGSRWK